MQVYESNRSIICRNAWRDRHWLFRGQWYYIATALLDLIIHQLIYTLFGRFMIQSRLLIDTFPIINNYMSKPSKGMVLGFTVYKKNIITKHPTDESCLFQTEFFPAIIGRMANYIHKILLDTINYPCLTSLAVSPFKIQARMSCKVRPYSYVCNCFSQN